MTRGRHHRRVAIAVCSLLAAFWLGRLRFRPGYRTAQRGRPLWLRRHGGDHYRVQPGIGRQGLLTTDTVRVGGSLTGTVTTTWQWNDPWSNGLTLSDSYGLVPELSALVFFDGRPSESSRFYGSVKSAWPFMAKTTVLDSSGTKTGDTVDVPICRSSSCSRTSRGTTRCTCASASRQSTGVWATSTPRPTS